MINEKTFFQRKIDIFPQPETYEPLDNTNLARLDYKIAKNEKSNVVVGHRPIEEEGRKIGYEFAVDGYRSKANKLSDILECHIRNIHIEARSIIEEISRLE